MKCEYLPCLIIKWLFLCFVPLHNLTLGMKWSDWPAGQTGACCPRFALSCLVLHHYCTAASWTAMLRRCHSFFIHFISGWNEKKTKKKYLLKVRTPVWFEKLLLDSKFKAFRVRDLEGDLRPRLTVINCSSGKWTKQLSSRWLSLHISSWAFLTSPWISFVQRR